MNSISLAILLVASYNCPSNGNVCNAPATCKRGGQVREVCRIQSEACPSCLTSDGGCYLKLEKGCPFGTDCTVFFLKRMKVNGSEKKGEVVTYVNRSGGGVRTPVQLPPASVKDTNEGKGNEAGISTVDSGSGVMDESELRDDERVMDDELEIANENSSSGTGSKFTFTTVLLCIVALLTAAVLLYICYKRRSERESLQEDSITPQTAQAHLYHNNSKFNMQDDKKSASETSVTDISPLVIVQPISLEATRVNHSIDHHSESHATESCINLFPSSATKPCVNSIQSSATESRTNSFRSSVSESCVNSIQSSASDSRIDSFRSTATSIDLAASKNELHDSQISSHSSFSNSFSRSNFPSQSESSNSSNYSERSSIEF